MLGVKKLRAKPHTAYGEVPGTVGSGVRVDTAVFAGYEIPPFYDLMVGKLIVL